MPTVPKIETQFWGGKFWPVESEWARRAAGEGSSLAKVTRIGGWAFLDRGADGPPTQKRKEIMCKREFWEFFQRSSCLADSSQPGPCRALGPRLSSEDSEVPFSSSSRRHWVLLVVSLCPGQEECYRLSEERVKALDEWGHDYARWGSQWGFWMKGFLTLSSTNSTPAFLKSSILSYFHVNYHEYVVCVISHPTGVLPLSLLIKKF